MIVDAPQTTTDETLASPVIDIQRLAWIILVSSTILFCSSSFAITAGVYYYFFRSAIPIDVTIAVSRGTAGLVASDFSEQIIRDRLTNLRDRPSILSTDAQSQATVSFRMIGDDSDYHPVLATITLENSSSATLTRASRPRFRWSDGIYWIELVDVSGEVDVFVSRAADRPFVIQIHTSTGDIVRIDDPGRYSFSADDAQIRLATREGEASLLTTDDSNNRLITRGQEAIMIIGRGAPFLTTSPENLLENSLFAFEMPIDSSNGGATPPMRWGCSDSPDSAPNGRYVTDLWQGRPALRLLREDEAQSHGKTGCRQEFGTLGRAVAEYTYLELQTTFLINFQSLSDCGVDGSECPMMLLMDYVDVNGVARRWYQGFYYRHEPQVQYPAACVTCGQVYQPHRLVSEQVWYTFETGNLFDLLTPTERPAYISRFEFYASGHQYDVFVSEVVLLAGQAEVVPPSENIVPSVSPTATASGQ
ncbi:MAG: hypothetical protein Q9P01_10235 [Anaerolineae bacterium]|nr:hypothetical protein [Anaerolineae bacterium]MDQ7035188.1 hypothetical protein [Anaerolineae bacterium]